LSSLRRISIRDFNAVHQCGSYADERLLHLCEGRLDLRVDRAVQRPVQQTVQPSSQNSGQFGLHLSPQDEFGAKAVSLMPYQKKYYTYSDCGRRLSTAGTMTIEDSPDWELQSSKMQKEDA
jgi:hypothetical protein